MDLGLIDVPLNKATGVPEEFAITSGNVARGAFSRAGENL